jgi:hypothetical protein
MAGQALLGRVLLGLSVAGGLLIPVIVRRFGRRGGAVAVAGCGTLFVRDVTMVATGVPARLKPVPRLLLFAEVASSAIATVTGLWAWIVGPLLGRRVPGDDAAGRTLGGRRGDSDRVAVAASVVTLRLHAARFAIYLSPGQGRA